MDAAAWDTRYAAEPLVWSSEPNALFAAIVEDWPVGRALDVACGEGRNALWLASRGWRVRAVDFSEVGIDKGRRRAAAQGFDVDWRVTDVTTDRFDAPLDAEFDGPFDLVALLYLHLPHEQLAGVVARCVDALAPGGRLVVVAHDLANLEQGVGGPQDPTVLPTADLLREWAGAADAERAEQVERQTEQGTAVDVVLVARKADERGER